MIIQTKEKIYEDYLNDLQNFDSEKNKDEKYILLVDLQKEIEKKMDQNDWINTDAQYWYERALTEILDLCKSPEQNKGMDKCSMESVRLPMAPAVSVFGEHSDLGNGSTGEKITVLPKTTSSCGKSGSVLSSPVQNHQWFCGGKEPCACMESFKSVQKKCTCPLEIHKLYKIYTNNKGEQKCGCCGGAL